MSRSRKFDTNFGHSRSRRTETNPPTRTILLGWRRLARAGLALTGLGTRIRRLRQCFWRSPDKEMAPEEEPPGPLLQTSFPLEVASEAAHQFSPQRSPLGFLRVRIGKVAANFLKTFFG